MAKENEDGQEKTEDPTDERREEFRKRGDVAVSRELSSVAILAGVVGFITVFVPWMYETICKILIEHFQAIGKKEMTSEALIEYLNLAWYEILKIITPVFVISMIIAIITTFFQTKLNFSWKKLEPDFKKFAVFNGIAKMFSMQAVVELLKSMAKMISVGVVTFLILKSEWIKVPSLILNSDILTTFSYWGKITIQLCWAVVGFLLAISVGDYFYNFMSMENNMKMTKKEIKDDYKNREVDPQVKGRMRRMQREILNRKMVKATEGATVLITNPTHYAIAIRYEVGMNAPVVVAKGVDFLALRMREIAKEKEIIIVENRPLARTLYKVVEVGHEIPESLYKAISEVIKYVFRIKGVRINKEAKA